MSRYYLLWGHPVPYSLTVGSTRTRRTYARIPKTVLAEVKELLVGRGFTFSRAEGGYVFYDRVKEI